MAGEGDAERLVVLLEARIRDFERNMQKASGTASSSFGRMRRDSQGATRQLESDMVRSSNRINQALAASSAKVGSYGKAMAAGFVGAFAGAAVVRGAKDLIDANTRVTNALKVAGLEGEGLKTVYDALFVSAQKNAAPLESLATLYGRVALVQKELGVGTGDLLKFTDNVSLALRVAGTDAQTASGSLLQLSQALGSGTVRAEEFNSVLEGATPIVQAVAAGLVEAGGSVAKLRQLVVDGKVSSQAFFAAFEAGSVILQEKVAGAELTTSQAMIRLQNVLQDAAGKFDSATGASASFAGTIDTVASAIDRLSDSRILAWLGRLNNQLETSGFLQLSSTLREVEAVLKFVDGAAGAVADSFGGLTNTVEAAIAATLGFDDVATAPAALRAEIDHLSTSVVDGTTDAAELRAELVRLGAAPLNLGIQIGAIMDLARTAQAAGASIAAIRAQAAGIGAAQGVVPVWDQPANEDRSTRARAPKAALKPVSLADYAVPAASGGGRHKGGGGGASKADGYAEALKDQQRRIDELNRETAAQSALNPLIDDYGYAIEKLRAQMDLENEATRAGLALTPERRAAIDKLAEGYATASAAAAKLDEGQNKAKRSMDDWQGIAKDSLGGIISDLKSGKSAAESFSNALDRITDKLLDMTLDTVFGGKGGGGLSSLLSNFIGGGKGSLPSVAAAGTGWLNANGNAFQGGRITALARGGVVHGPTLFPMASGAGLMGEAGPEAVMPLRRLGNGRLGVESAGKGGKGGGGSQVNVFISNNASNTQIAQRESVNEQGHREVHVVVNEAVAASIGQRGSPTFKALRAGGMRVPVIRRGG